MEISAVTKRRIICGDHRHNSSRLSTHDHTDWVSEQAKLYELKVLADLTGLSLKAVQNLRLGKSAANSKTITEWCRNDPQFRARYFAYCGGILDGEPEMEAALSALLNACARRAAT